jgi:hypothetical protein
MTAAASLAHTPRPRLGTRVWAGVVAAWGVVTGVAPHVLHHVGPLAGAALLAGAAGKAMFFVVGLVLSIPMLRRVYRRFGTLAAPTLAIVAFAGVFTFSNLVVAPRLTGSEKQTTTPGSEEPAKPSGHAGHHSGSQPIPPVGIVTTKGAP